MTNLTGPTRAVSLLALCLLAACSRKTEASETAPSPADSASAEVPLDRLAPGELEPGNESAFGLPIPKGMHVARRFEGSAHVAGKIDRDELVSYLKRRLNTSVTTYQRQRIIFPNVTLPENPGSSFSLEVWTDKDVTWFRIDETTVKQPPKGLTEAERWRRAGRNPDGTPLEQKRH